MFRYNFESVVGLLRQKFGRWFPPLKNEEYWKDLNRVITELAEAAIELDWYIHCDERNWDFSFTDPETGQAHGFLYKNRPEVQPHYISSDPNHQEGYPVDFIVTPSFRSWGSLRERAGDWGEPRVKTPMEVVIDMLPNEHEAGTVDGGGNSAGPSAK
ncbi:hypothetical protein F5144DRAFT_156227 [Chaetomium tenue]|uniref:Uncharacterized protein n=1 Tax=Chaetomium tenue TaxID=1854479 RepID=A0ACB7PBW3_9PEZI|nr:hypothetical protein F5144DRAFT_156227 [Chaetomium globosum]